MQMHITCAMALMRICPKPCQSRLQARFAVVDALRCWLEAGWRPELLPAMFVAGDQPASFDLPPTIAQVRPFCSQIGWVQQQFCA